MAFTIETSSAPLPAPGDWRAELKKKLDHHYKRGIEPEGSLPENREKRKPDPPHSPKKSTVPAARAPDKPLAGSPEAGVKPPGIIDGQRGEVVRQLFRYKLPEVTKETDRRIVTLSSQPGQPRPSEARPLEKPLIRTPVKARTASRPTVPEQKQLSLEDPQKPAATGAPSPPRAEPKIRMPEISKEILLSRFLSVVVDLVTALAAGFFFSFAAAQILDSPFPSPSLVQLAIVCAAGFFFLNSIFFLATSGQTPGMIWTELRLVTEEGQFPSTGSIISRTLLLIPSAATVVGLLWAVFDPRCRCWHDHLSGTRIVPAYFSEA